MSVDWSKVRLHCQLYSLIHCIISRSLVFRLVHLCSLTTDNQYLDVARKYFGHPVCPQYSVFLPRHDNGMDTDDDDSKTSTSDMWEKALSAIRSSRQHEHSGDTSANQSSTQQNSSSQTQAHSNWGFLGHFFSLHNISTHTSTSLTDGASVNNKEITAASTLPPKTLNCSVIQLANSTENVTFCPIGVESEGNKKIEQVMVPLKKHPHFESVKDKNSTIAMNITIPNLTLPIVEFDYIDSAVTLFFTVDMLLRLLACPSRLHYFLSLINLLDACALTASYLYIGVVSVYRQYRYMETTWVSLLNYVQIFRVFRLFRVVQNVRAAKVLGYSITQNLQDMTLLVMLLFVSISSFACMFYFAESRDDVPTIPTAWYWAVITMTTVGYGDLRPQTGLGQVIASFCAVAGILLLSITMPLFVNKFVNLYKYSCINENMDKLKTTHVLHKLNPTEYNNTPC